MQVAERRARCVELRAQGWKWPEIAVELGYSGRGSAQKDAKRALDEALEHEFRSTEHLRGLEVERIDALIRKAWEVLDKPHLLTSGGKVVTVETPDGRVIRLHDDGPNLAAIDRISKLIDQRCRLLGINAPIKVETEGTVRYTIVGVDLDKL